MCRKWLVLWTLWAARLVRQPTEPLRLPSSGSLVRGQVSPDGSHLQFFGIPYATVPPNGRFQAAGAEPVWDGVLDATNEHVRCAQAYGDSLVLGSENCLVLNVYTPAHATRAPVMVFIHGGGFKEGAGSRLIYGPDYLVSKGVVLVTFNYRVTAAGFTCLGIKEAPGNAGLKDQLAALKWVQKNIKVFGGDPDNVTIFGESAGAASVSLHVLSKASKGLFHKAIAQSGSSLAPWVVRRQPLETASAVAESLGYHTRDPQELYQVFMNHTLSEIILATVPLPPGTLTFLDLLFTPCIEQPLPGIEPFITEHPLKILSKGEYNKVPMIIGANSEEGYYFASLETAESLQKISFGKNLPKELHFNSESERDAVAKELQKLYMGQKEISLESIPEVAKLHGQPNFYYPAFAEAELIARGSDQPVYSYVFAHEGWRNFAKFIAGWRFWRAPGATHADDLFYLFSLFPMSKMFEGDMIDRMTTMWTNFAKYGSPKESLWRPLARDAPVSRVLLIGREVKEAPPPHAEALDLWRRLYSVYGVVS